MKKFLHFLLITVIIFLTGCVFMKPSVYEGPLLVPAEGPVPGVPAEVEYAGYWTRTASNPDELILTPEEIEKFNRENPMNGEGIIDIMSLPAEIDGAEIRGHLAGNASYFLEAKLYITSDIPLETAERRRITALMDTSGVPDVIQLKFGVMLRREQGKDWPTMIPLMGVPGDIEFDRAIGSALDMGDPVALLHVSRDGRWSYVRNEMYTCWIHSDAVAFGDSAVIKELTDRTAPLVAVGHRVSVYGAPGDAAAAGAIQMGSFLPLRTAGKDFCEVLFPGRGQNNELVAKRGYVRRSSDVSLGFLPYTLRNVYRQCFVLFGRRYGWGGMYEERDCSGYIMDVFRCFNIQLPINSTSQAKAAKAVISLEGMEREIRLELLKSLPGGISLLQMPGHIMIYMGEINGMPYAIHDFWAWRTPSGKGHDIVHRAARVAVTDLMLGEGSERGSFLDRLTYITILGNYEIQNP